MIPYLITIAAMMRFPCLRRLDLRASLLTARRRV